MTFMVTNIHQQSKSDLPNKMDALHKLENEVIRCVCVENLAYNLKTLELHSLQK